MESPEILNDAESWAPTYESETWPSASILSPVRPLALALLLPLAAHARISEDFGSDAFHADVASLAAIVDDDGAIVPTDENETTAQSVLDERSAPASIRASAASVSAEEAVGDALQALSLASLARAAFPETRPMEAWEKKATDSFFLSHFR